MKNEIITNKSGLHYLQPVEGDFSFLRDFLEGRMSERGALAFHGWMQRSVRLIMEADPRNVHLPGQVLIFGGYPAAGKSVIQRYVITPLLGGEAADPTNWIEDRTDFNRDLVDVHHLCMEDPVLSTDPVNRLLFLEKIKQITTLEDVVIREQGKAAGLYPPIWRLSISVNYDREKLKVLPIISPDVEDKLIALEIKSKPLPSVPDEVSNQMEFRSAFRQQLAEALPGYLWWLLNDFEIPAHMRSDRFGVVSHYDQNILALWPLAECIK